MSSLFVSEKQTFITWTLLWMASIALPFRLSPLQEMNRISYLRFSYFFLKDHNISRVHYEIWFPKMAFLIVYWCFALFFALFLIDSWDEPEKYGETRSTQGLMGQCIKPYLFFPSWKFFLQHLLSPVTVADYFLIISLLGWWNQLWQQCGGYLLSQVELRRATPNLFRYKKNELIESWDKTKASQSKIGRRLY